MNGMMKRKWLAVTGGALIAAACGQNLDEDPTAAEYGEYEQPLVSGNGSLTCSSTKKQLVCHVPPGNPGNAHSICVGSPAVSPHIAHHGDLLGACEVGPPAELPTFNKPPKHGPHDSDPSLSEPSAPIEGPGTPLP